MFYFKRRILALVALAFMHHYIHAMEQAAKTLPGPHAAYVDKLLTFIEHKKSAMATHVHLTLYAELLYLKNLLALSAPVPRESKQLFSYNSQPPIEALRYALTHSASLLIIDNLKKFLELPHNFSAELIQELFNKVLYIESLLIEKVLYTPTPCLPETDVSPHLKVEGRSLPGSILPMTNNRYEKCYMFCRQLGLFVLLNKDFLSQPFVDSILNLLAALTKSLHEELCEPHENKCIHKLVPDTEEPSSPPMLATLPTFSEKCATPHNPSLCESNLLDNDLTYKGHMILPLMENPPH